jgi:hypothetical protein
MNIFVNFGIVAAFQFWGSEKNRVCNLYAFLEKSRLAEAACNERFRRLSRIKMRAPARTCPHAGLAAKRVPGVQGWLCKSHPKGLALTRGLCRLAFRRA